MSHSGSVIYDDAMSAVKLLEDMAYEGSDIAKEELNQVHLRLTVIIDKLLKSKVNE